MPWEFLALPVSGLFLGFWTSSQPFLGLGASSVPFLGTRPFLGLLRASGPFLGFWISSQPFLGLGAFFGAFSRASGLFCAFLGLFPAFLGLRASSGLFLGFWTFFQVFLALSELGASFRSSSQPFLGGTDSFPRYFWAFHLGIPLFFDIFGRISGFNLFKPACWAPCLNLLKPPCGLLASIYLNLFVAFLVDSP